MATDTLENDFPVLARSAADIIETISEHSRRILLFGPPGVGKSTLTKQLAQTLAAAGQPCWCISADPGSPGFGIPGVVSLGKWQAGDWQVVNVEALCSLDAGRFRLPLTFAVRRLAQQLLDNTVLVDGPGVTRGVAGSEVLTGLVEAAGVDTVLAFTRPGRSLPLVDELRALSAEVFVVYAAQEAMRPGKRVRARQRTARWDACLADATEQPIDLAKVNIVGTPPPLGQASAWVGRQVALLRGNRTVTIGEALYLKDKVLSIMAGVESQSFDTLLIRDASRNADGVIETATPFAAERLEYIAQGDMQPSSGKGGGARVVGRVGAFTATLVNGVFGDPMLHVQLRHQPRSLLFDLGDARRLSARIAHQVTDVFVSHAHMDHIAGFLWLLRSRIGEFSPCRIFGPPGLVEHIQGFVGGVLWDRVGEKGPCFVVSELHGKSLKRFRVHTGSPVPEFIGERSVPDGVLLEELEFRVRGVMLDHRTPVIAYAIEPAMQINIRKDRLLARELEPGTWLTELKRQLLADHHTAVIQLPDGKVESVGVLGAELALLSPGKKLVYSTDLADTPSNRRRLVTLAQHAHTFFCEAPFCVAETEQAARTGHLTTQACGEIATAAEVARLVPFHFSRRYAGNVEQIYEEIQAVCARVVIPKVKLIDARRAG